MPLRTLPAELLAVIVGELWGSDLRNCLGVCRELRCHAAARVFRTVHLRFGAEDTSDAQRRLFVSENVGSWDDAEVLALEQAWDMMDAIASGGDFARCIKEIIVLSDHGYRSAVFERKTLLRTLRSVPHLARFAWIGCSPSIQTDVIEALSCYCPNLKGLTLGSVEFTVHDKPHLDLSIFQNLEHLAFLGDFIDTRSVAYHNPPPLMNGMIFLKRLDVVESLLAHVPLRVFANLTHLSIQGFTEGITLVLKHLSGLQDLYLHDQSSAIYETLAEPTVQFEDLVSFALCAIDDSRFSLPTLNVNLSSIASMRSLTKLLLHLPIWDLGTQQGVVSVLGAHCQRLTALGLSFEMVHDGELFSAIADIIPHSLRALSLNLPWNAHGLSAASIMPLRDKIAELPQLHFLHMGWGTTYGFRLDAEELAQELAAVRLLVLGSVTPGFWDVLPPPSADEPRRLERWSRRRVKERCLNDFAPGTEDGEWLTRYMGALQHVAE